MHIDVLTIFPKMFDAVTGESIIKRAQRKGIIHIKILDLRAFSKDKHRKVDDRPYGGGPGMIMSPQPFFDAVDYIRAQKRRQGFRKDKSKVILLSPQGRSLDQKIAKRISKLKHLILLCGHYEGVDERVRRYLADEEISIGDYVLTGGELPAMVFIDAVIRLLPGALGDADSVLDESFSKRLLEYPQYTRPAEFKGLKVPKILMSGNHQEIKKWRQNEALKRTIRHRPDLL